MSGSQLLFIALTAAVMFAIVTGPDIYFYVRGQR